MENENLNLYNRVRDVPNEAVKPITAGRLKGKSDINPMWRIKKLTEEFGVCGFGWKYDIVRMWTEEGVNGEKSAFVHINLYVKIDGEWSEPIQGIGGSSFVTAERNGMYVSDECYKMALTDAISVSCKALGFAADIYFASDRTKYTGEEQQPQAQQPKTDKRRPLVQSAFNDKALMDWIYKCETEYRNKNKRFSASNLLNANYIISQQDVSVIVENYEQYKINFSLL